MRETLNVPWHWDERTESSARSESERVMMLQLLMVWLVLSSLPLNLKKIPGAWMHEACRFFERDCKCMSNLGSCSEGMSVFLWCI